MTEDRLEQYRALRGEVEQLAERIRRMQTDGPQETSDSVTTAANFPYSKHTLVIRGLEDPDIYRSRLNRLQRNLARDRAELELLDDYISAVPDAQVRTIMRYKYIDGWGWLKIARRMGWQTESGPRNKVKRFLEMDEMCDSCDL